MPLALPLVLALAAGKPGPETVSSLKERYVSAVERADKLRALEALSRSAPQGPGDASALLDLFARFPDPAAREAALSSLALCPVHASLQDLALTALRSQEPESVFFGAHLAERARTPAALAELRRLAGRRLRHERAEHALLSTERGMWRAQIEALDVLASLDGEKALPILKKRASESAAAAAVIGRRLWTAAFPLLSEWAASRKEERRLLAREAARQPIDPAEARATREAMLRALPDPRFDDEFRHQLALKIGASSDDGEAEELARRHDAAPPAERLLWASALFISRRPAAVPVLARYAREDPDEARRRGAFAQLADMVGAEKAKALAADEKDFQK